MMYDSSPPSIKAKTQNSPAIKKARTISRLVLAFSCRLLVISNALCYTNYKNKGSHQQTFKNSMIKVCSGSW